MIILTHVLIALSSVVFSSFVFLFPSKTKIFASYLFTAATIGSGIYLVLTKPANILSTCVMGLLYTGFVLVTISAAQRKLAKIEARKN